MKNLRVIAECIADDLERCGFNDITDSSGYYIVREFAYDPDRAVDVHKSNENGRPHYVLYCSYEDGSGDWKCTDASKHAFKPQAFQKVCKDICLQFCFTQDLLAIGPKGTTAMTPFLFYECHVQK